MGTPIDLGGTDLTVNTLLVGAATPGSAGVSIGTTENASTVNVGASGTAGTLSVFPATASKGKTTLTATNNTGNTTTTITNAAQAAARTYTIPDAGASASFVMTQGTQTLAGATTLSGATTHTGGVTVTTTGVTITDVDVALSASTGTKIGTATSQKLGFFNAAPVAQQATTGTTSGFTAGSGTATKDDSTYTGGTGSTAYRVSDIVLALKHLGLLAG